MVILFVCRLNEENTVAVGTAAKSTYVYESDDTV